MARSNPAGTALAYGVLMFLLLPSLLIVPVSFGSEKYLEFPPRALTMRWYREMVTDADWLSAILFSSRIAVLVAIVASVVGTMAVLAMVRGQGRGKAALNVLLLSPMIVPNIVTAIALYFFFSQLHLLGTTVAFVLAHSVLALPYVVLTVSAAVQRLDTDLELAALSCGASRFDCFRHVTLPLILPALLSGAIFAFIVSFDESVISFFLSGVRDRTLPRKMFENIDFDVSPILAAVATSLTLLSLALLGLVAMMRRASEMGFRRNREKGRET